MNPYQRKYDVIINGASFLGIVLAMKYKLMNKSVLLINEYGFVGGSITESLNCLQKICDFSEASITKNLISEILKEKNSLIFKEQSHILFNPEVVKYSLQKQLEKFGVDLLFHVMPFEIKLQNQKITELTLFGREGKINFDGEIFIDASSNYQLLSLVTPLKNYIEKTNYNLFISSKSELPSSAFIDAQRWYKLDDGRYWVSFKI
ncbi:MAG: FAD-dependent oxidoreductase, partial [Ignavibacteria bacterium]|nr:FAD-dependent oxidoreductase [Ignavibacteria bacterium]